MGHIHSIYDTDPHFSIDPVSRVITNQSSNKTAIMQNDHNSERFTFEMPRYIEEHDMSLCDKVQVHFINIGDAGKRVSGLYEVTDLQISPADNNVVICSWLVSNDATKLVGPLTFVLRFACTAADRVQYAWHTAVHSGIAVGTSINNSEAIVNEYIDVLENWYLELLSTGTMGVNIVAEARDNALADIKAAKEDALANVSIDELKEAVIAEICNDIPAAEEESF